MLFCPTKSYFAVIYCALNANGSVLIPGFPAKPRHYSFFVLNPLLTPLLKPSKHLNKWMNPKKNRIKLKKRDCEREVKNWRNSIYWHWSLNAVQGLKCKDKYWILGYLPKYLNIDRDSDFTVCKQFLGRYMIFRMRMVTAFKTCIRMQARTVQ